ncbi:hypothetical protein F1721_10805 [Saccharopolyspora hirsuta]|uniref:Tetratricopeptide repeat protein n=1 Tax=Saccharopolyspora hirsuta TaxID=1837 RepID=A0A5M7C1E7_SACHI|nr:hypothetical protein [Saccharopolyspora hirsuta]KAA5835260.1 hypothetical protein F1721_10805 [Saccharopolyspora hirsuta]
MECVLGHYAEATALLTSELDALDGVASPDVPKLIVRYGFIGLLSGSFPSRERIELAVRLAAEQGDQPTRVAVTALNALHLTVAGKFDEVKALLDEASGVVDALPDAAFTLHPEYFSLLGWAEGLVGRYSDAERHLNRGMTICQDSGHVFVLPLLLAGLSNMRVQIGQLADARRAARQAREVAQQINASDLANLALALEALSLMWLDRHQARSAMDMAERAAAALPPGTDWACLSTAYILAMGARLNDDPQRSRTLILDVGRGSDLPSLLSTMRPMYFEMLCDASVALGKIDQASEWAQQAIRCATRPDMPHQRAYALAAVAHVQRARGEFSAAMRSFDSGFSRRLWERDWKDYGRGVVT